MNTNLCVCIPTYWPLWFLVLDVVVSLRVAMEQLIQIVLPNVMNDHSSANDPIFKDVCTFILKFLLFFVANSTYFGEQIVNVVWQSLG